MSTRKMLSTKRLKRNIDSMNFLGGSAKATSQGVTRAVKTRARPVTMSQYLWVSRYAVRTRTA
eukprot:scaffold56369_cov59-Phaeocystis_antarctica.AAC.2